VCGRQTRKKKDSERERERGREKVRERVSEREKERKKERERERNRGGERARKRRLKQRWCSTHNLSWRPESHKDKHNASALPTFDRTSSISTGIFLATTSFAVTFLKINSAVPLSVTVCHLLTPCASSSTLFTSFRLCDTPKKQNLLGERSDKGVLPTCP